jgi:hypothetical protein
LVGSWEASDLDGLNDDKAEQGIWLKRVIDTTAAFPGSKEVR